MSPPIRQKARGSPQPMPRRGASERPRLLSSRARLGSLRRRRTTHRGKVRRKGSRGPSHALISLKRLVRISFLSIALTHHFRKATSSELAPAIAQDQAGSELKRSVETRESSDEPEHSRPTKIARYFFPPPRFREADQCPRTAPLSQPLGVAIDKPRGLADTRRRSPMVNTVIEDFEYRRVESESESEDEDDLGYPGNLPVSLVSLFSYSLNCC